MPCISWVGSYLQAHHHCALTNKKYHSQSQVAPDVREVNVSVRDSYFTVLKFVLQFWRWTCAVWLKTGQAISHSGYTK